MKSRVPSSGNGIESATGAERPAGMSLGQWLNSRIAAPAPVDQPTAPQYAAEPARNVEDVAEIHRRLDGITQQIEQMSQRRKPAGATGQGNPAPVSQAPTSQASASYDSPPPPAAGLAVTPAPGGLAHQLNDAIARLDQRLAHIAQSSPPPANPERQAEAVERAASQVYPSAPAINSGTSDNFDFALAEIAARHSELDRTKAPEPAPALAAAPAMAPPTPPSPNLTSLERQLHHITSQMETLRRPDHLEQSIALFREELAEIRRSLTEAMPRQAIESLENEIRALAQRIDHGRQSGIDANALAGVERALSEIYDVLRTLTPAEQLAGFDAAIRSLAGKVDLIVRSNEDPQAIQQLEAAIAAMRNIAANVASNEALAQLSGDIHGLSAKVDQLAQSGGMGQSLTALEQHIAMLTTALETREPRPAGETGSLEAAVRALSDRIDQLQTGQMQPSHDGAAAMSHIEQRISYLLERLETSEPRFNNLTKVEDGLADIMRHLERQRESFTALSQTAPADANPNDMLERGIVESIKRELSDVRHGQSEIDRRTQDSLEAVHSTLGHVVDRLAMIEGDLRRVQSGPLVPDMIPERMTSERVAPRPAPPMPPPSIFSAEAFDRTAAAAPANAPRPAEPVIAASPFDTLLRPELPNPVLAQNAAAPALRPQPAQPRPPIDPTLPPDHPLEPGSRQPSRSGMLPSERIAGMEPNLDSEATVAPRGGKSDFIAAARRAAQAAAAATSEKPGRVSVLTDAARSAAAKAGASVSAATAKSTTASRIRSLLVGASVVVIVLGTFKMAMTLLDSADAPATAAVTNKMSVQATPSAAPPRATEPGAAPETPAPTSPLLTSPTALDRQSLLAPPPVTAPKLADATPASGIPTASMVRDAAAAKIKAIAAERTAAMTDVTGALPAATTTPADQANADPAAASTAPVDFGSATTEKIPETLGGPNLRAAAQRGDPTAAYEVAVRYAEGKGVTANYDEAAKWYDRAAQKGVVLAMFRLGTLLEKGLSGKRDIDGARRYYMMAAERGNAKAMHNLAVLDADGGGKGPNYKSASIWFKKAAASGIADSQFNLAILYARGIGVEQNLAESYKWFSLAAAQGDADAGRKRDDIAKRLDPQSLAAAKLAIQTFTPESQPNDAVNVATPAGGWDAAAAQVKPAAAKHAAKPKAKQTAAR